VSETEPLRLEDLVAPLPAEQFLASHWAAGRPHLSAPNARVVERLRRIERLASVEAYLSGAEGEVSVFGPDSFRSRVPVHAAVDFLDSGYNLYFIKVEQSVPQAKALFFEVARDLGVAPWQIHLEAFAGRTGGISSRHYDHDINLQVLMDGEKQWRLEPNQTVDNPLVSYHPRRQGQGQTVGFMEELYASGELPPSFSASGSETLTARAGSVMFLPRGHWHETRSMSGTWGINLVIKGVTWAAALGSALLNRLHADPRFRAYCQSAVYAGRPPSPREAGQQRDFFERLRRAALQALSEVTAEEAALAMVGDWFQWAPQAAARRMVERQGQTCLEVPGLLEEPLELEGSLIPVLRKLVSLTRPFSWPQAQRLSSEVGSIGLYNLLRDLVDNGLLVRHGGT
jgi:50S ribosomal protein L16 3-hydroxylase